jgi:hypothetical protein
MSYCSCRLNSDLPDLLQNCDYIINVLPSTPDTTGLLNGDILKHSAQKHSVFINIGRGTVIKEEDLVNALSKGWLSAAILDVFETEPLPPSSALWTMPQVKCTFLMKLLMSVIDSGETHVKYGHSEEEPLFLVNPKKASFMHSCCSGMGHFVFKIKVSCTKTEIIILQTISVYE